jgi:glycosyltransferase involved in cell wall biosynthesis
MSESFLAHVTPVILTYNEAPNIGRSLERLQGFGEVLVVDSGSTDDTLAIVARFPNTRVLVRPFDSFAGQWNHVLREGAVATEWVLAMDADYILGEAFIDELARLAPAPETVGYRVAFEYWVFGRRMTPTCTRRSSCSIATGKRTTSRTGTACARRLPASCPSSASGSGTTTASRCRAGSRRRPDTRSRKASLLAGKPVHELRIQDRLRRMIVITPWLVPLYCLTVRRGALDGWAGIYYALQRSLAEALLSLKLIERKLERDRD